MSEEFHTLDLTIRLHVKGGAVSTKVVCDNIAEAVEKYRMDCGLSADEDAGSVTHVEVFA